MTLHTPSRRRSPPALPVQPHRRHFPRRTVAPWRRQPQVVEGRSGRGRRVAARPRTATRAPNLSAGTASLLGARRASLGGSSPDSVRVREARGPTSARGYGDGDGVGDRPSARAVPSAPRRFPSAEPSRTSEDEESEEEREDLAESSLLNKLLHTSLVENSHHVEVLQQDPSSPLFSIRTFEELHLPQNLIAQSQSGTGKTAAFVLAMLSRVKGAERYPQCLCLAPTYELALQIGHVAEKMGRFCNDIRVTYAVQGNRVSPGTVLEEQIVIGTPGTMLDWCFKRRLLNMRRICMFVLDEADVMIDTQGFSSQSIRIQRALPKDCQMLLFSATFKETLWKFALQIVSRPIIIKLRQEELTLTNIRQYYFVCRNWEQKYEALCNLYGSITIGQAMIFCQVHLICKQ
ncbi:ATP-dependent RNA helicase DDX25 isoform X6 [Gallus gallus]|uniref:ATP-dependent RNA helicase DDX25 isoform X6 n=1 Tax=Gallus gallus TaxID=9031 RepID=UPI001AE3742B|nr:ATP-dependent RNA helicase DDX25 isoform X6 [Gallus gallus]